MEGSRMFYKVLDNSRKVQKLEKKWKNEWYPDTIQCQGQQDLPATIVCFKTTESHFKLQDNTHLSVHRHMTVLYIKVVATTLSITEHNV